MTSRGPHIVYSLAMPRSKGGTPEAGSRDLVPALNRHRTLEEAAYRDLRRAIVEGRFAPGERIVAATVAATAGISRIPVMQALRRLEADGFVRITPHKDVVVLGWARGEIHERFLLMAALEVLCIRQSAGKITPEVRAKLRTLQKDMAAARLEQDVARAAQADGYFHRKWRVLRFVVDARRGGFAGESLGEHELILKALEAGDLDRAAKAIEYHRLAAMERLERTS